MNTNAAARAVPNLGPWLTANEAVAYLGLPSRKALYQAVRRGQLPVHRLGRRLRFSESEIDLVLRRKTVDAI